MKKKGEKHEISQNKHGKKVNAWVDISKGGETDIQHFYLKYSQRVIRLH